MSENQQEKIMYQFIMNYKGYRRQMIITRITVAVIVAGGMLGFCAKSIILGIVLAAIALFVGALAVLLALNNEQTYTVYDTRIVIKVRGNDKRTSVPMTNVVAVKYKRAFYEKSIMTGTVTVTALNEKGKKKKYKLRHVFDAAPAVKYIDERIRSGENKANESRE